MLVLGILIVVAVIVAAVMFGKKSSDASFISFPCRTCGTVQNIAVAETMRRVSEAHAKGGLAELNQHEIKCMKCGASQTADWLMHPRVKAMINDLDSKVYRDQTAQEYMNIASESIPGAPSLNSPIVPGALASPPAAAPADPNAPPPMPGKTKV